MKDLYFITGNKSKFEQAKIKFPEMKQIDFDIPEIQELDSKKVIEEKLKEVSKDNKGRFFCEDISVEIEELGGLPGPFIKWFSKALGNQGIWNLVKDRENKKVITRCTIGYRNDENIIFFEGIVEGTIVEPRGEKGFGWDPIFLPEGSTKTLGEMSNEEKEPISPRGKALNKLKDYLENGK